MNWQMYIRQRSTKLLGSSVFIEKSGAFELEKFAPRVVKEFVNMLTYSYR